MFAGDWNVIGSPNNNVVGANGVLQGSYQASSPLFVFLESTDSGDLILDSTGDNILVALFPTENLHETTDGGDTIVDSSGNSILMTPLAA